MCNKPMPLSYRILTRSKTPLVATPDFGGLLPLEWLEDRYDVIKSEIKNVPIFDLTNVAEFYAQSSQEFFDLRDCNMAPPFQEFIAEWQHPIKWNMNGREVVDDPGQWLCACSSIDMTKTNAATPELVTAVIAHLIGYPADRLSVDSEFYSRVNSQLASCKWLLVSEVWNTQFSSPTFGAPAYIGLCSATMIDSRGRYLDWFLTGTSAQFWSANMQVAQQHLHVLSLGFSFMHCKNVSQVEMQDGKELRKTARRFRVPDLKRYTLVIDPMRQRSTRSSDALNTGIKQSYHICRGSFATYTDEGPLFGKYTGTFWRPDHVRGTKDVGEVKKGYSVANPTTQDSH